MFSQTPPCPHDTYQTAAVRPEFIHVQLDGYLPPLTFGSQAGHGWPGGQ